jgi:hypothetical protein
MKEPISKAIERVLNARALHLVHADPDDTHPR